MEDITLCRSPFTHMQLFGGGGVKDYYATAVPI